MKLRLLDESEVAASEEVVRLSGEDGVVEPVARLVLPTAPEAPARLEGVSRDLHEGRTNEPGMEAILEGPESLRGVEQTWGGEGQSDKPAPYGWFAVIALLVGGAIFMAYRSTSQGREKVVETERAFQTRIEDDKVREKDATVLVDEISRQMRAYMTADSVEKMLPHVRQPERVRPLMEDWYARHPLQPFNYREMGSFAGLNFRKLPFWRVEALSRSGESRELMLEQISDTATKVDWETDVVYQPMDWDRYVTGRLSDQAYTFRVMVTPDNFYSHEFSDDQRWMCFRLGTTSGEEFLFGYARPGGNIARSLLAISAQTPGGAAPAMLTLRIPPGLNSPRGVVIESVAALNWILMGDETPISDAPAAEK